MGEKEGSNFTFLFFVLALLVLLGSTLYEARQYHFNVTDDAYISFQYAKNLAQGNGLVFNPGERVEGYTNFLWVILLTPLYKITQLLHVDFTRVAIYLNILIGLANLTLIYRIGNKFLAKDGLALALTLLLCVLDNSFPYYAMSAMENHLYLFWMLLVIDSLLQPARFQWLWIGLFLSLVNLTRPDGILFVLSYLFIYGLKSLKSWQPNLLKTAMVWLLVFGGYFVWRYHYYDSFLPNTFYLKVGHNFSGMQRGLEYTRSFLEDRYYLPLVALFAIFWISHSVVSLLLCYLVVHVLYIVYVGGDFYSGHRFYVFLLPFIYLLIGKVVQEWRKQTEQRVVLVVACLLTVGLLFLFAKRGYERGPYQQEIVRWGEAVDNNVRYMKWLGQIAPSGSSMVVGDIGATGFFADIKVLDYFGVIDPVVARQKVGGFGQGKPGHEKTAPWAYLLDQHPTYIKWGYIHGDLHPKGYYIFTDFPSDLQVEGLWIREDRDPNLLLSETTVHFNSEELADWQAVGDAFESFPAFAPVTGQQPVFGQDGNYLNTFTQRLGDQATGEIVSSHFPLLGNWMLLRVGGGRDLERLRVSLLVDGQRLFSATGHNFETLGRRVWNIGPYRGQQAQLEVVDTAQGPWGHLLVDEVVQLR